MNKVRINSKIYAQAFQEGWIDSLAIYVHLAKVHSGKSFYFKTGRKTDAIKSIADKSSISFSTLCRHLNVLKKNNLVHIFKNEIKLATNKEMQVITRKYVYIPETINILKDIKTFLKSIPIISNLKSQQKAIDKIEHFSTLKHNSERNRISYKQYKQLRRYEQRGGRFECDQELTLSYSKICELTKQNRRNTISEMKRVLKEGLVLTYKNFREKLFTERIKPHIYEMLVAEGMITGKTFYYKGWVFKVKSSEFKLIYIDAK